MVLRCLTMHSIQPLVEIKARKVRGNGLKDTRRFWKVHYYTNFHIYWSSSLNMNRHQNNKTNKSPNCNAVQLHHQLYVFCQCLDILITRPLAHIGTFMKTSQFEGTIYKNHLNYQVKLDGFYCGCERCQWSIGDDIRGLHNHKECTPIDWLPEKQNISNLWPFQHKLIAVHNMLT